MVQTSFGAFGGGLKLHQGTQNITSNIDAASVSDISKSEVQGGNKFQMDLGMNNDTMSAFLAPVDQTKSNNETKMSDNEAFMAYMSKGDIDDDEDDWSRLCFLNLFY